MKWTKSVANDIKHAFKKQSELWKTVLDLDIFSKLEDFSTETDSDMNKCVLRYHYDKTDQHLEVNQYFSHDQYTSKKACTDFIKSIQLVSKTMDFNTTDTKF